MGLIIPNYEQTHTKVALIRLVLVPMMVLFLIGVVGEVLVWIPGDSKGNQRQLTEEEYKELMKALGIRDEQNFVEQIKSE